MDSRCTKNRSIALTLEPVNLLSLCFEYCNPLVQWNCNRCTLTKSAIQSSSGPPYYCAPLKVHLSQNIRAAQLTCEIWWWSFSHPVPVPQTVCLDWFTKRFFATRSFTSLSLSWCVSRQKTRAHLWTTWALDVTAGAFNYGNVPGVLAWTAFLLRERSFNLKTDSGYFKTRRSDFLSFFLCPAWTSVSLTANHLPLGSWFGTHPTKQKTPGGWFQSVS